MKRRKMKVNILLLMIAAYIVAIIFYAFVNLGDNNWTLYWHCVDFYSKVILVYGFHKAITQQKISSLEVSLLYGIVVLSGFSTLSLAIWFKLGKNIVETPYVFCIVVAASVF